jgi:U3 small nucleolar ribonucleoprotein protein IMP4
LSEAPSASRRILITTSRRPSPRIRSFVKDLVAVIPGAFRFTRGHYSMEELAREAYGEGADRIVVVGERRGNPGIIRVYAFNPEELRPYNIVSFIVKGVTLSREAHTPPPPPGTVRELVAVPLSEGVAEEFADAFVIAFHARLKARSRRGFIEARLKGVDPRTVIVEFYLNGEKRVGPRMRLGRPKELVKAKPEG